MKFSEMPYARPDLKEAAGTLTRLTRAFAGAGSFDEAHAVFLEEDRLERHLDSLYNLVYIRHSVDTRDAFYDGESAFWDEQLPVMQEYTQRWQAALLASPYRAELESRYGRAVFLSAELAVKAFTPEMIPLMQEENALATAYEKLLASAQIPFMGEDRTIPQMEPFQTDADDAVRLAAWQALGAWYAEQGEKLDKLYDKLVALRTREAEKLGYATFTPLGYLRMNRNCYGAADVEAFRAAVVKYAVPLSARIYEIQAKRLGKAYPMNYADNALWFRTGNPKPAGGPEEILAQTKHFYDALSPETSAFFRTMQEGELMDLLSKPGKEAGGYCTSIHDYEVPFIFANFNGTSGDVETMTHEGGHAFADWLNRSRVPCGAVWPSLEACEVHSTAMEYFGWLNAEGFYGKDARKFMYYHLAGGLTFIPYGTMVDHFQHIVYENPGLTPAERHAEWKRLSEIYMPWMRLDAEIPFYGEGRAWQRQHHIYSSPFYYIDYCLSQAVALELWAMMTKDREKAFSAYMAYTRQGGAEPFTTLLENAGLNSPFREECLRDVCETADRWLTEFDFSTIE